MLTFPADTLPISGGFAPYAKSVSGGQSLSGFEQVTSQLNDRWVASYGFPIRKDADVLKFRGFVASMRGRANTVLLPAFDLARAPYVPKRMGSPIGTSVIAPVWYLAYPGLLNTPYHLSPMPGIGGVVEILSASTIRATLLTGPVVDGMWVSLLGVPRQLFSINVVSGSEITAAVYPEFTPTLVPRVTPLAHLHVAAALNATSIQVMMTAGGTPQPGNLFSIGTKLYSIVSVSSFDPYVFEIWPSIRSAAPFNTAVEFAHPACEMRFASDSEGGDALSSLAVLRFATITLKFDEVPA